ncbi:MAG: hypothetical protein CG439_2339 [Methylococcaceae bacterium NSP1-2]|nr:hypothetical protein [Methylococcaceae bacterium]OYV15897.1 MAG: hypothetical protein CG439_2339 [Methylococcaceae bacterium NSP1-2]
MRKHIKKTRLLLSSLSIALLLSGCGSIGKGVAEAILEKSETEDTRVCQVWGKPFNGVASYLANKQQNTKILFVHGVGDHVPGYTTHFLEKLAKELNLNERSAEQKNIQLNTPLLPNQNLGNLRVTHLLNEQNGQELTFYELTWSEITRKEKELLAFDTSGDYDFRRAKINGLLKKFSNDTGPDPVIYLGESRVPILAAFGQSFCWMASSDFAHLPSDGKHDCTNLDDSHASRIDKDNYIFMSHSLGSRITIDGLQRLAGMLAHPEKYVVGNKKMVVASKTLEVLRNKHIPIFMLSNQLPILQLGRELPEVAGQDARYCEANGADYKNRMVSETDIIAFSDPNDLLSYGIPHEFADKYIDSRLCAKITNVNINIANVMDAFGFADLANPMQAHVGYDTDDRVVAMIAKGIGHAGVAPLVKQRCEFTKEVK